MSFKWPISDQGFYCSLHIQPQPKIGSQRPFYLKGFVLSRLDGDGMMADLYISWRSVRIDVHSFFISKIKLNYSAFEGN